MNKKIIMGLCVLMVICIFVANMPHFANAASVRINKKIATVYIGKSITLKLKNTKKNAKWISSNKKIASVSKKGKVKGKKKGKVTITATIGRKKYKCRVTVKKGVSNTNSSVPNTTMDNSTNSTGTTASSGTTTSPNATTEKPAEKEVKSIKLTIGTNVFRVTLSDTVAAKELAKRLPLTINMNELNGNEKYYYFKNAFTESINSSETIHTGDLMLYGDDCLVLFYKEFKTLYQYTKLGHIEDTKGLASAVGNGKVTIGFEVE